MNLNQLIEDEGEAMLQAWCLLGKLTLNNTVEDAIETTRTMLAKYGPSMGTVDEAWRELAPNAVFQGYAKWAECRKLLSALTRERGWD